MTEGLARAENAQRAWGERDVIIVIEGCARLTKIESVVLSKLMKAPDLERICPRAGSLRVDTIECDDCDRYQVARSLEIKA